MYRFLLTLIVFAVGVFLCLGVDMSKLIEQLKKHEGLRLKPYLCSAGKLTIGYGRNIEDIGISKDEAEEMLLNDIDDIKQDLLRSIPWYEKLDEARRGVLENMAFNLGISRLMKFKKTLAYIKDGYFNEASVEMLDSRWANQVGNRAKELSQQMKTGVWQ